MVRCISAFLDFCYIARRNAICAGDLDSLKNALARFHHYRNIFIQTGVRVDISLPRQHSLMQYLRSIRLFGSPNGLCSSITESKHIKAVKEPWRRSSRYHALVQMLRTISRLDKLATARRAFTTHGMMEGSTFSYTAMVLRGEQPQPPTNPTEDANEDNEDDDLGPVSGPKVLSSIELATTPGVYCIFILFTVCSSLRSTWLSTQCRRSCPAYRPASISCGPTAVSLGSTQP